MNMDRIKSIYKKNYRYIHIALGVLVLAGVVFLLVWQNRSGDKDWGPVSGGSSHTVVLSKDGFVPKELNISLGDTVVFSTQLGQAFWPASDLHPTHGIYPDFDPKQP